MINFSTLIISTILIYTHMMTQNEINVLFLFPFFSPYLDANEVMRKST